MKTIAALVFALSPSMLVAQSLNDSGRSAGSTFTGMAAPAPNVVSGSGSFTGSEPTMSPRFFRSGTPGDACTTFSSGNFQYQDVVLYTDTTGSLTVSFDPQSLGTGVFVTFHTTPFNPASICDNYVWSFGSSQAFTETFTVPVSTEMHMIVSGVANAPGVVGGPYIYSITGADPTPPVAINAVPAPAMDKMGLAVLALVLGALGALVLSRRS